MLLRIYVSTRHPADGAARTDAPTESVASAERWMAVLLQDELVELNGQTIELTEAGVDLVEAALEGGRSFGNWG